MTAVDAAAVVIPARDEELRVGACLASVATAADAVRADGVPVLVVVVCDRCRDRTAAVAAAAVPDAVLVASAAGNVGAARAFGIEAALARLDGVDPARLWLATTDADSVVPADWLRVQLALAAEGWNAVAGTIRVADWSTRPAGTAARLAAYRASHAAPVHGANLGLTAAAYRTAGGVPPQAVSEDAGLWAALRAAGVPAGRTTAIPVTTSARRDGRAPHGFAALLDRLEREA